MSGIIKQLREGISLRSEEDDDYIRYLKPSAFPGIMLDGYTRLSDNTEFQTGINVIADLISNMTIWLIENEDGVDKKVKNGLSRVIDIEPNKFQTRKDFMFNLTKTLLIEGNQITKPIYDRKEGYLASLKPYEPNRVGFLIGKDGYLIELDGKTKYKPTDLLHFKINPSPNNYYEGTAYTVTLKPILDNLKQATKTKRTYMSSKYQPPLVVSVEADNKAFATVEGRRKYAETYLASSEAGEPWIIPSNNINVESVKPLTLKDIAINETVEIDKKTVAAVLGIPAFLLGVGDFNKDEYNNFINSKILSIATVIQQELTKKILYSPYYYFKFNIRSLHAYSLKELTDMNKELRKMGVITGNEVRDGLGYDQSNDPVQDELLALENYIPATEAGNQSKLKDSEGGDEDE